MENAVGASRVLIVDDNAANRELAVATLEDQALEVLAVESGARAIEAVVDWRPDCILLDIRMPDMDGFETCRRIRALPEGAHLPVLFLTAQRDIDTFDAALETGADDFLTKPVRPAELVLRVQTALKVRSVRSELREQYDLVKHQRDALLRLQLQKERLSAFLVHDLKNPINSLDLWAQQALRDPNLSERAARALMHIREETRTLTRMVLNLLDISRSEEGGLVPRRESVDLKALLDVVFDELNLKAAANEVKFENNAVPIRVLADVDLLRRVFLNLVENAVRHSPSEGTVTGRVVQSGANVEISIRDEGVGIPEACRAQVFQPFVQLDNEHGSERVGRGLGLTFCRLAVEAHGGHVRVEDGHPGAVFVVVLPLQE
jgi:two-component system sensor histidine kinase/response regulator